MFRMLKRNKTIPWIVTEMFTTCTDNQTKLLIQVYEGERQMKQGKSLLGTFEVTGIAPAPRGVPRIEVTFDLDANGTLTVRADDKQNERNRKRMTIDQHQLNLIEEQMKHIIRTEIKEFTHDVEAFIRGN